MSTIGSERIFTDFGIKSDVGTDSRGKVYGGNAGVKVRDISSWSFLGKLFAACFCHTLELGGKTYLVGMRSARQFLDKYDHHIDSKNLSSDQIINMLRNIGEKARIGKPYNIMKKSSMGSPEQRMVPYNKGPAKISEQSKAPTVEEYEEWIDDEAMPEQYDEPSPQLSNALVHVPSKSHHPIPKKQLPKPEEYEKLLENNEFKKLMIEHQGDLPPLEKYQQLVQQKKDETLPTPEQYKQILGVVEQHKPSQEIVRYSQNMQSDQKMPDVQEYKQLLDKLPTSDNQWSLVPVRGQRSKEITREALPSPEEYQRLVLHEGFKQLVKRDGSLPSIQEYKGLEWKGKDLKALPSPEKYENLLVLVQPKQMKPMPKHITLLGHDIVKHRDMVQMSANTFVTILQKAKVQENQIVQLKQKLNIKNSGTNEIRAIDFWRALLAIQNNNKEMKQLEGYLAISDDERTEKLIESKQEMLSISGSQEIERPQNQENRLARIEVEEEVGDLKFEISERIYDQVSKRDFYLKEGGNKAGVSSVNTSNPWARSARKEGAYTSADFEVLASKLNQKGLKDQFLNISKDPVLAIHRQIQILGNTCTFAKNNERGKKDSLINDVCKTFQKIESPEDKEIVIAYLCVHKERENYTDILKALHPHYKK